MKTYAALAPDAVSAAIDATHAAWLTWRSSSFEARAAILHAGADLLRRHTHRQHAGGAGRRAAEQLEAGCCFVNAFVNIKTVFIK